jgi:catechol 2,3-dioxygenase-like lactoylglutathione lyase family enzyme
MKLGHLSILVNNIEDARNFYIEKLGFILETDQILPGGYRWLSLLPDMHSTVGIVFVLASNQMEIKAVGNQAGRRVLFTLKTEDCTRDYEYMKKKGVFFESDVREMPYGKDVVLNDLWGNRIDLVEVKSY